jgi:hypothetical protein
MGIRQQHGVPLLDRAILVVLGNLCLIVLAEVTLGAAYGDWRSSLFFTFLPTEIVPLLAWVLTDPRRFAALAASIRSNVGAAWRWTGSWPRKSFGGARADNGHPEGEEIIEGEVHRYRDFLTQLSDWYETPPEGTLNRPMQWTFLWICTLASLYCATILIVGTGGGTKSPFVQLPLLIVVFGGMMSDRQWNAFLLIAIGGAYTILIIFYPESALLTEPPLVVSAHDVRAHEIATAIVTVAVLTLGVWAAYASTTWRRQQPTPGPGKTAGPPPPPRA